MNSISLVISSQGVECIESRLDPEMDSRLNSFRLVHEQTNREGEDCWFFFAKADLTKPEALARAQEWYTSTHHSRWPGLFH